MNVRARLACGCVLAAIVLLVAFGCSSREKSPLDPSRKLVGSNALDGAGLLSGGPDLAQAQSASWVRFFPLDSGSVWSYTFESRTISVGETTGTDSSVTRGRVFTRMLGPVPIGGTPYARSVEATFYPPSSIGENEIFYRQDATGLYEFDGHPAAAAERTPDPRASSLAAACEARLARATSSTEREAWTRARTTIETRLAALDAALHAAGPLPATGPQGQPEIRRLAYPLRIGNRWVLHPDPLFVESVDERDVITVGSRRLPGWRIRIESAFFGPEDRVWLWYSTEGELRFYYHIVAVATDLEGNPIGGFISEWDQRLTDFRLAGRLRLPGTNPLLPGPSLQTATARGASTSAAPYSLTTR